jgi:predicted AlkP superfamily pyrophosphatase or phosphodiesterase
VILFQGLNQINLFSHDLTLHDREHNEALREDILFEHIRFDPDTDNIDLYLANTGSIDSTIASVTMVKIDTQDLILAWKNVPATNATIQIEDHSQIQLEADLNGSIWNSTFKDSIYKITVATSKGNFFSTVTTPGDNFNS